MFNKYFILGLVASTVLTLALLCWLFYSLSVNWMRRNRRGVSYLLPAFISLCFVYIFMYEFKPRLLDSIELWHNNTVSVNFNAEGNSLQANYVVVHGQQFILSPGSRDLAANKSYRFVATRNAHLILEIEEVKEIISEELGDEVLGSSPQP